MKVQCERGAGRDTGRAAAAGTVEREPRIVDHRAATMAQGELATMMNSGPRMARQRAFDHAIQRRQLGGSDPAEPARQASGLAPAARDEGHGNRTGLPSQLKAGIESLSGLAMDQVRVHYNSDKPAQLQAHAYAQGHEIHLAPGQEAHLPHEAWHIVQQAQGRVKPTIQLRQGTAVNDDPALEAEADTMGARAWQGAGHGTAMPPRGGPVTAHTTQRVVQRVIYLQNNIKEKPAIKKLQTHTLYRTLHGTAEIYIRSSGDSSDMQVRNTHNWESFKHMLPSNVIDKGIDYVVTIAPAVFDNAGLDVLEGRSYQALGGLGAKGYENAEKHYEQAKAMHAREPRMQLPETANEEMRLFDITHYLAQPGARARTPRAGTPRGILVGAMPHLEFRLGSLARPEPEPTLDDSLDLFSAPGYASKSGKLSAETVILHELGHIEQHVRTSRQYLGKALENITHRHIPPLPVKVVERTAAAYNEKLLRAPIWTELLDMNNTMLHWYEPFKHHNTQADDARLVGDAEQMEKLGRGIINQAMVWIEYDNITHTEHPEARWHDEPIRHIHGAEGMIDPAKGTETIKDLAASNNASMPADLHEVAERMAGNAIRLTADIVKDVGAFAVLHEKLHRSVR